MKFNCNEMHIALCYIYENQKNERIDLWKEIKKIVKKANYYVYFYYLCNLERKINFIDLKQNNIHKTKDNKYFYRNMLINILKNKNLYDIKFNQKSNNIYIGNLNFLEICEKFKISNKITNAFIKKYKVNKLNDEQLIIFTKFAPITSYRIFFYRLFDIFLFFIPIFSIFYFIISIK